MITTQRQLRAEFWRTFPRLDRRRITDYAGTGKMHQTDTRVAWHNWIDQMNKSGEICHQLAERATL